MQSCLRFVGVFDALRPEKHDLLCVEDKHRGNARFSLEVQQRGTVEEQRSSAPIVTRGCVR